MFRPKIILHTCIAIFFWYTQVFQVKQVCPVGPEEEDCLERQAHQDLRDLKES